MDVPVAETSDGALVAHAEKRGLVRLSDGRVVRLVRWRGRRPTSGRSNRDARVVGQHAGAQPFTVKLGQVASIIQTTPASPVLTSRPESVRV